MFVWTVKDIVGLVALLAVLLWATVAACASTIDRIRERRAFRRLSREAARRGIDVCRVPNIAELRRRIARFDEVAKHCRLCAARDIGAEILVGRSGKVEPICVVCSTVVRTYRQGICSEGRASEHLGLTRLQLRFVADRQAQDDECQRGDF